MTTVTGLTEAQVQICERLWNYDSEEAVLGYIHSLPRSQQQEARTLMTLMVQAAAEEDLEQMTSYPAAEQLLARVQKG
jgi:hypothetical protein